MVSRFFGLYSFTALLCYLKDLSMFGLEKIDRIREACKPEPGFAVEFKAFR